MHQPPKVGDPNKETLNQPAAVVLPASSKSILSKIQYF